jgi:hypothetical protein
MDNKESYTVDSDAVTKYMENCEKAMQAYFSVLPQAEELQEVINANIELADSFYSALDVLIAAEGTKH